MNSELLEKILSCGELPSPPVVAARIVQHSRQDCQLSDVIEIVSDDPATSLKLIRLANSAAFRGTKACGSISEAVTRLGVNVSIMTSLSFSLSNSLQPKHASALDYDYLWRRSVTAAAAARFLAMRSKISQWEECFLAALVQDIGVLAADTALPAVYADLPDLAQHEYTRLIESQQLGCDHAEIGACLLQKWQLPEQIIEAVRSSHSLECLMAVNANLNLAWCVAYSGVLADAVLMGDQLELARAIALCRSSIGQIAGASEAEFTHALFEAVKDAEQVFETSLVPNLTEIAATSKEIMFDYMLGQIGQAANDELTELQDRVRDLEAENRRDGLTGVYNRQHFDDVLEQLLNEAQAVGGTLSLMFVDADHFKQINDEHGHQAGDEVLKWLAGQLRHSLRDSDVVARYGGEEFVAILPATNEQQARTIGDSIVQRINAAPCSIEGAALAVTVSVGVAAVAPGSGLQSARELVVAADQAMYYSKKTGRNRCSQASLLPTLNVA